MAKLHLTEITKVFTTTTAVENFTLTVEDGEFITLLGPSGCGKTTTLRMIAGFIKPTGGSIQLGDRVITSTAKNVHLPPEVRHMGMVFQSYAVWPHKNVFENIAYPLRLRHMSGSAVQQKVTEALRLVNLENMDDRYPNQLSGGQQQRVALARALVMEPDVLLLDEPLSNLDAKLRERMRFEIVELQQRLGITVVYVTHDQEEAMSMSDRVVVMQHGVIQQIDTPEIIYDQPRNHFVAEFIGAANVLAAHAEDENTVCLEGFQNVCIEVTSKLVAGQRVDLLVRPEAIALTSPDDTRFHLTGQIQQRLFLGSMTEYRVRVDSVTLRVQSADGSFYAGDVVGVRIQRSTILPPKPN